MAKALQCPACGRKHPVDSLPNVPSFPCVGCGQSLKVPAQFRGLAVAGAAVAATPLAPPSVPAPPEPDRTAMLPPVRSAGAPRSTRREEPAPVSPPVMPVAPAAARPAPARVPAPVPADPPRSLGSRLGTAPLLVLCWIVAIALGGIITVYVARKTGWLSGQRLVDVFTGTGITRYLRVIAIVPVWAVISTVLITLMIEGGRSLARARRAARAERPRAVPGS